MLLLHRCLEHFLYCPTVLGRDGKKFRMMKIRTMHQGSDMDLVRLAHERGLDSLGKITHDPRITPLGKLLRRYWIDELPQVIHLAQGELKLVGIRPKTEAYWSLLPVDFKERALRHRPGLLPAYLADGMPSSNEVLIARETRYLDFYERDPIKTDSKYFFSIMRRLLTPGVHSH